MTTREKPLMFTAQSVLALLNGSKSQTRRLLKLPRHARRITPLPRPALGDLGWVKSIYRDGGGNWIAWSTDKPDLAAFTLKAYPNGEGFPCPHGRPGDGIWVRETWACVIKAGESIFSDKVPHYRADGVVVPKWRPSIFMPRWASRIDLRLTDVRVECLHDISEADAVAEGGHPCNHGAECEGRRYRCGYRAIWNEIHGKDAWDLNPFVWVLSFVKERP